MGEGGGGAGTAPKPSPGACRRQFGEGNRVLHGGQAGDKVKG
jgi:hypothetical protein